ncbi:MAG TPA: hypothetical protein ENK43_11700 [Planctomycetes bacterium]|nr:hypothetical protein [Planctomycetota bacterium]
MIPRFLSWSLLLAAAATAQIDVRPIPLPEGAGGFYPRFAARADGAPLLGWLTRNGEGFAYRVQTLGDVNEPSRIIARGEDWFANWADFPLAARDGSGRLLLLTLQELGEGRFAYGIRARFFPREGGAPKTSWLHDDLSPAEHGFPAVLPLGGGGFLAVWLDGRAHEKTGNQQLFARVIDANGAPGPEIRLDDRTCECCCTAIVSADGVAVAAWRDRRNDERRDIRIRRRLPDGTWEAPFDLHLDGWKTPG